MPQDQAAAQTDASDAGRSGATIRAHAVLLGERIGTQGFEQDQVISATPLVLRVAHDGLAVVFRYGAVVLFALGQAEEAQFIGRLRDRVSSPVSPMEEEIALIQADPAGADAITSAGVIQLREHSAERFSIIADALAKSVALAHHEREVAAFFDSIEPISRALVTGGFPSAGRKSFLKLIGAALAVQHRVSGRMAVREKPDLLWDRPDLERLYGRLETEYELIERAETLDRKLQVVGATATAMIDLQDTARSQRLELLVVVLILVEVALSLFQLYLAWKP
jgi:uncharacterized Rmd1/YagE family protein